MRPAAAAWRSRCASRSTHSRGVVVRKRLAIVGYSDEGLGLIPLLEANPDVELFAVLADDAEAARRGLVKIDPKYAMGSYSLVSTDPQSVLRTPGLVALID